MLANLPLDMQERFSGGFELIAKKPVDTNIINNLDSIQLKKSLEFKNMSEREIENEILLNNIVTTCKWRLISKVDKVINKVLPIGSKRRRLIKNFIMKTTK